ncbi:hypothetical protein [Mesobacillus jeotgali]|uniref:Uncharacterized protein n=1 Tax=Mesobacillus jeotgali TaxID=129985 RepID=A0ABY9VCI2_9BACI|nr:hypothetical protein [Mesobacillus jeotgali]WNF21308.1 hypothetical protein RH061_14000 [Mesobacillus jeotgali]
MEKKLTQTSAKAHQRTDTEDRAKEYKNWHRQLDRGLYMLDVDAIEWRYRKGKLVPVAVMELTRTDSDFPINQKYLNAIVNRFENRDLQAKSARLVAEALNVEAYIVLFRYNCKEFHLYNLTRNGPWVKFNEDKMEEFLKSL